VDTAGIVLIKINANRVTYWNGREEGDVETLTADCDANSVV